MNDRSECRSPRRNQKGNAHTHGVHARPAGTGGLKPGHGRHAWSLVLISALSTLSVLGSGHHVVETFEVDPAAHGWERIGDPSLFRWEPATRTLLATWDSSKVNSYLALPIKNVLTREDDFRASLDLRPLLITPGSDPAKPGTFEMAFGFLNRADATSRRFVRGTGTDSPNLVEWDYFPDTGFGATIASALVATNGHFESAFTFPLELKLNALYHIELAYSSAGKIVEIAMTENGKPLMPITALRMSDRFGDFRVDTFALSSYSDAGQTPDFPGSILAQARIDNIVIDVPLGPQIEISGGRRGNLWEVAFDGLQGWDYWLERSTDLRQWTIVAGPLSGRNAPVTLQDLQLPTARALYRITATKP